MLFLAAIDPPTLVLLKTLQAAPELVGMRLVGGTALALLFGHRKSVYIDLFGSLEADSLQVAARLKQCGDVTVIGRSQNIGIYSVNGIKLDIVNYPYPWLEAAIEQDGVRLAGLKDITAMKLAAIANRGTKKDFIDMHFLLSRFRLAEMLELYLRKFADGAAFMVLKSLTYFDDAEGDPLPVMLTDRDWATIKRDIVGAVEAYLT